MDAEYDEFTDRLLDRERKRHEAATTPRSGFDGSILFGKFSPRPYETAVQRQLREATDRRLAAEEGTKD